MNVISDDGDARSLRLDAAAPPIPQGLIIRTRPVAAGRDASSPESRVAVDRWENEGGNLPSPPGAPGKARVAMLVHRPPAGDPLAAMQARFEADVSNGLVGPHHNTFEHRSRVLRQLTEASRIRKSGPGDEAMTARRFGFRVDLPATA